MPMASGIREALHNLRMSAFGSDDFEAYSAVYSWLSNQMAHGAMGFFLAVAAWYAPKAMLRSLAVLLTILTLLTTPAWYIVLGVIVLVGLLGWWLFAWGQFQASWFRLLMPYLFPSSKLPLDALTVRSKSSDFPVDMTDFWADKLTDLNFWYIGMLFFQIWIITTKPAGTPVETHTHATHDPDPGQPEPKKPSYFRRALRLVLSWICCILDTIRSWVWPPETKGRVWRVFLFPTAVLLGAHNYQEWTSQKKTFDRSQLPSGWTRLCQFDTQGIFPDLDPLPVPPAKTSREQMVEDTQRYMKYVNGEETTVLHCIIKGGWPVNRSALAAALGTEFICRGHAVQYYTASKLLEGPKEFDRWKRQAERDGVTLEQNQCHPYSPKCVIIDDLSSSFPRPIRKELRDLALNERPTITCPVDLTPPERYDMNANARKIFEQFHCTRDTTSTIWVLTCDSREQKDWINDIGDFMLWGKTLTPDERVAEIKRRIVVIDLGSSAAVPAIPRGAERTP